MIIQTRQWYLGFQSVVFHELAYVGYILLSEFTILMYSNILLFSSRSQYVYYYLPICIYPHTLFILLLIEQFGNKMHDTLIDVENAKMIHMIT